MLRGRLVERTAAVKRTGVCFRRGWPGGRRIIDSREVFCAENRASLTHASMFAVVGASIRGVQRGRKCVARNQLMKKTRKERAPIGRGFAASAQVSSASPNPGTRQQDKGHRHAPR